MRTSLAVLVLLSCGLAPDAVAQDSTIVRGVVADTTGAPLPEVTVEALGTSISVQTDTLGRFQLDGLQLAPIALTVRRMGYVPVQFIIDLDEGGTLEIPAGQIVLQPLAVGLTPVEVEAERAQSRRPLVEFYERREENVGSFITREEFMSKGNPQKPTDVIRRMSGFRVGPNPNYMKGQGFQQDTRRWIIMAARQLGGPRTFGGAKGRGECPPLFFLDGQYIGDAKQDIDAFLSLEVIEAVEAYGSAATMPLEFNRPGSTCGVIAFWTR